MRAVLPPGYRLAHLAPDHAPALAAAYTRNREHLAPWDPVRPAEFFAPAAQHREVEARLAVVAAGTGASWVLLHDTAVVGRVNLNNVVRGVFQSCHLGYWVDRDHTGRGLATAMVQEAASSAVGLGLHRIEAAAVLANDASQAVLRRCGFEEIGVVRDYLFIAGRWQDHRLFHRLLHDQPPGPGTGHRP